MRKGRESQPSGPNTASGREGPAGAQARAPPSRAKAASNPPPRPATAAVWITSTVDGPGLATASRWTTASPNRATTYSTIVALRSRRRESQRLAAARHGDDAGAPDIDQAEGL